LVAGSAGCGFCRTMAIKSAISDIIGKTITGVVVTRNDCEPEN
jgi:hypothetical protein